MGDTSLDVLIRAARADDADAIERLIIYLDRFHSEARPDLFRSPSGSPRGDGFVRSVLDDPQQDILVAVGQGWVVGYAHILLKTVAASNHRLERRYCEIETISVDPQVQRLGVGRNLIEAASNWAKARGVRDLQIAVHEFNKDARTLYERLGFIPSVAVLRRASD